MKEATLSSKNQIVFPREAREALKVKAGDKLLITVLGHTVIVMPKPQKYSQALKGLGRGLYSRDYIERERGSWE